MKEENNSQTRVGVSDGEIVMFHKTFGDNYHGYVIEWDMLEQMGDGQYIMNLLQKSNKVDKNGKPLL